MGFTSARYFIIKEILSLSPIAVSAYATSHIINSIYDVSHVLLIFPNDVHASISVSWLHPIKERKMFFIGSDKMILFDDLAKDRVKVFNRKIIVYEGEIKYRDNGMSCLNLPYTEPLVSQCQHSIDCIRTGQKPIASSESALHVIHVISAIERSIDKQGEFISLSRVSTLSKRQFW